jgi:hypothetical protein
MQTATIATTMSTTTRLDIPSPAMTTSTVGPGPDVTARSARLTIDLGPDVYPRAARLASLRVVGDVGDLVALGLQIDGLNPTAWFGPQLVRSRRNLLACPAVFPGAPVTIPPVPASRLENPQLALAFSTDAAPGLQMGHVEFEFDLRTVDPSRETTVRFLQGGKPRQWTFRDDGAVRPPDFVPFY